MDELVQVIKGPFGMVFVKGYLLLGLCEKCFRVVVMITKFSKILFLSFYFNTIKAHSRIQSKVTVSLMRMVTEMVLQTIKENKS